MDAMAKDREEQGIDMFLLVSSGIAKKIRKNQFFVDRMTQLGDNTITSGVVGAIAGCNITISNKLTSARGYILKPQCLTAFMKRDVNIETNREMEYRRTRIGVDCHYVIAIEDYDKIVAIEFPKEKP
jgi:hypothetical protein